MEQCVSEFVVACEAALAEAERIETVLDAKEYAHNLKTFTRLRTERYADARRWVQEFAKCPSDKDVYLEVAFALCDNLIGVFATRREEAIRMEPVNKAFRTPEYEESVIREQTVALNQWNATAASVFLS